MNNLKRVYIVSAATVTIIVASALAAFATASDTTNAVVGGGTTLNTELVAMGLAVIPLAAAPWAIKKGWKFVRSFF